MKNKIFNYDFLIVGAGLIGSLTALALQQKKLKVLLIDKKISPSKDQRTLAVNANSKDFLTQLGIWNYIKTKPQLINKIIIKDYKNSDPLIFNNEKEPMGSVINNSELLNLVRERLKKLKILEADININLEKLIPNQTLSFHDKKYSFKKIIISIGKNITSEIEQKSIIFDNGDYSHVGFFKHNKSHDNIAYEIFNKNGPLAVLPSPSVNNKRSTFIYSSNENTTYSKIKSMINKNFFHSHGKIFFDKNIYKFPVTPHLTRYNKNYLYVGDSLKSIHPVAGQGWNLGVKDIQLLTRLIDQYPLESDTLNSVYYSRRIVETSVYFCFTTLINYLYENQSSLNDNLIKLGYKSLKNISFFRNLFIKQAMGRLNLVG